MLANFRTYQLSLELYEHCQKVEAPYHLRDQLLRASLSIVLNVAEGSAKPSAKERCRFYSISLASCRETQALIQILKKDELWPLADQLGAYLFKLARPK